MYVRTFLSTSSTNIVTKLSASCLLFCGTTPSSIRRAVSNLARLVVDVGVLLLLRLGVGVGVGVGATVCSCLRAELAALLLCDKGACAGVAVGGARARSTWASESIRIS